LIEVFHLVLHIRSDLTINGNLKGIHHIV
jgi:hypothetical protein